MISIVLLVLYWTVMMFLLVVAGMFVYAALIGPFYFVYYVIQTILEKKETTHVQTTDARDYRSYEGQAPQAGGKAHGGVAPR